MLELAAAASRTVSEISTYPTLYLLSGVIMKLPGSFYTLYVQVLSGLPRCLNQRRLGMPRLRTERTSEKRYVIDGKCGNSQDCFILYCLAGGCMQRQRTWHLEEARSLKVGRRRRHVYESMILLQLLQLRSEHILSPIRLLHRGLGLGEPS